MPFTPLRPLVVLVLWFVLVAVIVRVLALLGCGVAVVLDVVLFGIVALVACMSPLPLLASFLLY